MRIILVGLVLALIAMPVFGQDPAADVAGTKQVAIEFSDAEDVIAIRIKIVYWLDAPVAEVWDKMLDIDKWWPHCYESDSVVIIEPWAGGRIYERFNDSDEGGLYGHVVYIKEGVALKADGQWAMPGAAVSGGVWRLEESEGGTLVTQSGEIIGNFDPELMKGREDAQQGIVDSLRAFVEEDRPCQRYLDKVAAREEAGS